MRFVDPLQFRNGEPDSAFEFSFGEWALLAIDSGIDVDFWSTLAPGLIQSQEIYMRVYRPDGPGPFQYNDYRPHNFREENKVSTAFKIDLAAKYSNLSMEELRLAMGRNCFGAFQGNLIMN